MPPRSSARRALLVHDGELDDFRTLLERLDVACVESRGDTMSPPAGLALVVATARRALSHPALSGDDGEEAPTRIVVTGEDSPGLRARLRAVGFDYLVRLPLDPAALRLLLLHALYRGPDRRHARRFPSGREIRYRVAGREHRAVLGDLSESGCRLLHADACSVGRRIEVDVPAGDGGSGSLTARGTVLRAVPPGPGDRGPTLAVAFDAMAERDRERLRAALAGRVVEPTAPPAQRGTEHGSGSRDMAHDSGPREAERRPGAREGERRGGRRGTFRRRVVALREEADRVLMGCDLSIGGMRVDSHPDLGVGQRLRLALYVEPGSPPWIVGATIVRNDPQTGMALRFDVLPGDVGRRLERFVASLPAVEPLQRGELGVLGAVVSQILD